MFPVFRAILRKRKTIDFCFFSRSNDYLSVMCILQPKSKFNQKRYLPACHTLSLYFLFNDYLGFNYLPTLGTIVGNEDDDMPPGKKPHPQKQWSSSRSDDNAFLIFSIIIQSNTHPQQHHSSKQMIDSLGLKYNAFLRFLFLSNVVKYASYSRCSCFRHLWHVENLEKDVKRRRSFSSPKEFTRFSTFCRLVDRALTIPVDEHFYHCLHAWSRVSSA